MSNIRSNVFKKRALCALVAAALAPSLASAQQQVEEVIVTGIRASLANALEEERNADKIIEVIIADDIGKLPDQNLAEVLENITGIQITRSAGVGTGVQIRGTNANRVEINGVSTVGSGSGRSGINFEDVNASIISAVEVLKSSEAKTIEGSVGGTVNLRTIRPLDLKDTLGSIRIQGEDSSLSTEGIQPRISGAWGDNWMTDVGEFGVVISGSYTEQEAVAFRPRADRDNRVQPPGANPAEFLSIQFLLQEQENDDYETKNLATTFEWKPNDSLKLYADVILNDQERSRDNYRIQASGVSAFRNTAIPSEFETANFGVGPGSLPAALAGTIQRVDTDDHDPNLRFSSETGSRVTDSRVFSIGGEWQEDKWTVHSQLALTKSDTVNPSIDTTLNFINPNTNLVARVSFPGVNDEGEDVTLNTDVGLVGDIQTLEDAIASVDGGASGFIYNDNSVPYIYDLSGGSLAFGIDFASPEAPSREDLLNPANVVLDQVNVGRDTTENTEDAFRVDVNYALEWNAITSLDFGLRVSESSSKFNNIQDSIGGFSRLEDSPNGTLFEELLVRGPSNYGDGDGRNLFVQNFLLVDPDRSFSDPNGTLEILQNAVIAHDPTSPDILNLESDPNAFYDVSEETTAFYLQANFESGIFQGNFGLRYLQTDVDSVGFGTNLDGSRSLQSVKSDYDFILPRINIIANVRDDVILRFAYGSDIRRPDFDDLGSGFEFTQAENATVQLGNPRLEPEEVDSFDISADWYFAPAAVASIGYFNKKRTNIFGRDFDGAVIRDDPNSPSGRGRETDPTCPGGGIFNPRVRPAVLGDPSTQGLCVDFSRPSNDPETTTQSGIELAVQYDLSSFEDQIGWASGFGVLANYTIQDFSGGSVVDTTSGRGQQVLGDVSIERGLLDFSENAYNFTLFFEKYGLSARARYTWREAFRTLDFAGGAGTTSTYSFPVYTLDRGQLNASINYDVTENFNIGVEAVNLTESNIEQRCVSENGPLCFVGIPDRRIIFGGSYKF